jgi:predicted 2-oxoglutarate/Fe(II)-dependent dioxygenase YbiX
MNQKLLDNNYIIIPSFISPYRANNLKDEFVEFSQQNNLGGDGQIPTSSSDCNYISFLELLCEKTLEVSEILEETVLPTYAYSRVYKNGSILKKHSDRDACEISLTLHLGGDKPWLIWIKTPEGEDRSIELKPGDAMMYRGTIAEHWRDEYDGEEYVQVFLHYVRSRGEYSYAYFDKIRKLPSSSENLLVEDEKEKTNISTPELIIKKPPTGTRSLEDFIITVDSVVPDELCDRIIKEYTDCDFWTSSRVGDGNINDKIRNCDIINISEEVVINKNFDIRKKIDEELFECASKTLSAYRNIFPEIGAEIDTGYSLLRYKEGQFYVQHTDSFKSQQRSLSCSFLLNSDFEGGEFAFFDREMIFCLDKGSSILFPSNFMFPHEIMPVTSGTRYSIITWYV